MISKKEIMKKLIKVILVASLCVVLLLCLSSCEQEQTYEDGYIDGYSDGRYDAKEAASDHSFEMYKEGYDEAYIDFVESVICGEAVHYAVEHGGWHPEEAMSIIDAYNGQWSYGELPITEKDYKDAVSSLYYYYDYFYNAQYQDKMNCGYDFYE